MDEQQEMMQVALSDTLIKQMNAGEPKETKETFDRLVQEDWSEKDAMVLMGKCLILELFDAAQNGNSFDNQRYIGNLLRLPENPVETRTES